MVLLEDIIVALRKVWWLFIVGDVAAPEGDVVAH